LTPDRIGVREVKPGVWAGLHTHFAADAQLIAPCWIGERAWIEAGAAIGPNAVLEREVFIARGADVSQSMIGPETFVGQFTEVRNSIAWGSTLVNWERDSCLKVPDAFLLCSREPQRVCPIPAKTPAPIHARLPAMVRFREYVSQILT
jgi:carbonic anhydrase/acetyltransferase-like protein (isoleucine patch superfamily)